MAVHFDHLNSLHTLAVVDDENKKDIYILRHNSRPTQVFSGSADLLSDAIVAKGGKIVQIAFGEDSNILYIAQDKGGIAEFCIDEQTASPLNVDTNISCPSIFSDQNGSIYLYSDSEIQKLDCQSADTIVYAKGNKKLFRKGTTAMDSHGNIHSLIRKPFCSEHAIIVYTQAGEELRAYGTDFLSYGESFAISKSNYGITGEGDSVHIFCPNGELFKSVKGFGLVSDVQVSSNDTLCISDSWRKKVFLLKLTYPPSSLYEQSIQQAILYLNDLPIFSLPPQLQKLFEEWNFHVRVEIWTTKELEIAFTEVYRSADMPVRRSRTESRAVISNSKSFFLKLRLGIEFNAIRRIISTRLKQSGDIDLYTREHTIPNKLPQYGILKSEHNKIAAIFV